ncbi:MAG: thioredoxin peroxidase [marine bacterium B5-7]|nr:MAG: thioredoxin peroxidase [marine bacterium B5-7]
MTKPTPRQQTPALQVDTFDGRWNLHEIQPDNFSLIVVYRGLHCPVCKSSLRDLDRKHDEFSKRGVEVIAISGDTKERAQRSVDEWGIKQVTVGYGLTESTARSWGLYVSEGINEKEPARFFEPALFLVRQDGTLYAASIQSMPFARPAFDSLLGAIDFVLDKDYPARGEA